MKRTLLPLLAFALAFSLPAARAQDASPAAASAAGAIKDIPIVLHTDKGDIDATLFATKAPITVGELSQPRPAALLRRPEISTGSSPNS